MLYVGPLVATRRHAHHAAQVVIAPQGLCIEDGAGGHLHAGAAVIPPRMPHRHGACAHAAMLFLDGDDLASRALSRDAEPRCETWGRGALDVSVPRDPTPEMARALIASILSAVDLRQPPEPRHPAARRMCAYLDGSDPVDLASLSHEAGLSPRQMRHAFARDVGLPMRAYLRWKRLRRAIAAVEGGASLSAAAAAAGFADSAHLSRVFREQFGMTPTQGLSSITWRTLD
ncbi:AraC family transcriptional regulator [Sorangium cellulosum]|uniref:AraC family transcriptional regulator n=2 Tax=Sorangium TaxID=39643 RepID=A0A4P2QPI7_SORCE|nr:AraC family transcriptional regulator [Sorangium cellulosum]AUX32087.1 AraC family transcriptional regulator [Sorangium cellulosum]WCQ91458.1 HTH-type transcriptional activator RhaR [Sorangium sp. Soce836]